jgi:protease-4
MKRVWITLGVLLLLLAGLMGLIGILLRNRVEGRATLSSPAILEVDLEGEIVEKEPQDPFIARAEGASHQLVDIIRAIDAAGRDDRIRGIYLRVGSPGYGWAKAEEIRERLLGFRETGKFVYAYVAPTDELGYYVALAADSLFLLPDGVVELNGFSFEAPYIVRLFEKLGLEPQVENVGIYKSAADMLKRSDMSDAEREVTESLLGERYERFVDAVVKRRGIDRASFTTAFDEGIYVAEDLMELGLVDDELYEPEVRALALRRALGRDREKPPASIIGKAKAADRGDGGGTVAARTDSASHDTAHQDSSGSADDELLESDAADHVIDVEDYVSLLPPAGRGPGGTIALVYAIGEITSGEEAMDPVFGRTLGSASLIDMLREIAADDRVDAVVIRIDSPGGDAVASEEIWAQIDELRRVVPVVASMSDVAGSGGYYIAAAADRIVAAPSTITGSIGVLGVVFNAASTFDKLGIGWGNVKTNEAADFPTSIRPMTEAEHATFRALIEDTYRSFVERVAEGRERSFEQIDSVGQGRIWSGTQARERGLVDEVGGLDTAIALAKQLADIEPSARVGLLIYPKEKTLLERLKEFAVDQGAVRTTVLQQAAGLRVLRDLGETLTAAGVALREGSGRPLAVMPFVPRIH